MTTIITILYILLGGLAFIALLGTIGLVLPKPVERARQKLEATPGRSFLVGIINVIFWFVILAIWFAWSQYNGGPDILPYVIGSALGVLLVIGLIIPGIPGLVGLARLTGARWNSSASPLGQDLCGGLILVLACMTPYVGWFILTPAMLSAAIGAGLLTFFQRKAKPPALEENPF
jgi:hypothetical protein